jgi:hypothetical protein
LSRIDDGAVSMTAAYIHLVVVHLPVVGSLFVAAWLALGHFLKSDLLLKIGYGTLVVLALFGIAAYYSGPSAYEQLEAELAASKPWVEQHAVIGRAAFMLLIVTAALAVQALLQFLQEEPPATWLRRTILGLVLVLVYLLAWSAHLGGEIRHPEIRDGFSPFPSLDSEAEAAPSTDELPADSAGNIQ